MQKIIWFALVIFFIITCGADDYLFTVGNERIGLEDFKTFYQFTPNDDSLRRVKIIDDFINQELAIRKAISLGYKDDPVVKVSMETNKRDIIIRTYYQIKVLDKIKIKEGEVRKVYDQFVNQYHLAEIVVQSDSLARYITKSLKNGVPFESLLVYSLDTISPGGDIGLNPEFSIPPEILKVLKRTKVGKVAGPVNLGDYIYFLKVIEHKKLDSPKYKDVRENIRNNLLREKAMSEGERFVEQILKNAKIEYNQEGLELLLKPESTLTKKELETWIVKKYDTNYVRVKTVINAVQNQLKRAPDLDPKFLIERELIPDIVYDLAQREKAENYPKIKKELKRALNSLIYQKFYSDKVIENIKIDSLTVVDYFTHHKSDYPDKKLEDVYSIIYAKLRDEKISQLRDELFTNLREEYQPKINQKVYVKLLRKEAK